MILLKPLPSSKIEYLPTGAPFALVFVEPLALPAYVSEF